MPIRQVFVFGASDNRRFGFTEDETGGNLPAGFDPRQPAWKRLAIHAERPAERIGVSEQDILAGLDAVGYFIWPPANLFEAA